MASNTDQLQFSNHQLTTKQIEGLIGLFEGDGLFDFWFANVCNPSMDVDTKAMLRRNFPRNSYLRDVILKLAWSMPIPKIGAVEEQASEKAKAGEKDAAGKRQPVPLSPLEEKLKEIQCRRNWEGNKTFDAAIIWYRVWAFVTGDLFVKTPLDYMTDEIVAEGEDSNDQLVCFPERMPSQRTYIMMNKRIRKVIDGYRFLYNLGTGQFTEQGDQAQLTTEIITRDEWTIEEPGGVIEKVQTEGMLRVIHMAWEEREDGPRGIPLMLRLADKWLHLMSCEVDRRLGNKMGSIPIYKLINATGVLPPLSPGVTISLKTETPTAPADFAAVPTGFNDESLRREVQDAKRALYDAAFLPFNEDKENAGPSEKSGKAMQMLSKDQVVYREAYQGQEKSFLQELFSQAATLEELPTDPDDIEVTYDDLVMPDPVEQLAQAQFYWTAGLELKALQVMGIDIETAQAMLDDLDQKRADAMMQAADQMGQVDENGDPIPAKPGSGMGGLNDALSKAKAAKKPPVAA